MPGIVSEVGKSEAALPLVAPTPLVSGEPDRNAIEFPRVFAACAVTRAMENARLSRTGDLEAGDSCQQNDVMCTDVPWSVSQSELVKEQQADESLESLWGLAHHVGEVKNHAQCYFIQNDVLMRKWVPHGEGFVSEPVFI